MEPDELAQLLAERLDRIAPPGIRVRTADGMLYCTAEPGRFPGQQSTYSGGSAGTSLRANFDLGAEGGSRRIISAAEQALRHLQGFVEEETHDPWPGRTRPPQARAEICDRQLRMWFAEGTEVLLECEPIPMPDLDGT